MLTLPMLRLRMRGVSLEVDGDLLQPMVEALLEVCMGVEPGATTAGG